MTMKQTIDPFTVEVIKRALISAAEQMFIALGRTAKSSVIYEVLDYGCAITDASGRMIAQANGIPAFIGVLSDAVLDVIGKYGLDELEDGDIIITNDPYMGGATHQNDAVLIMPIFVNGHGSNCGSLDEAARRLREDGIYAFVFNWWQSIATTLAELFPDPTAHAGSIETSLMLVIDPNLVREERFNRASESTEWGTYVEGVQVGFDAADFSDQGNVGDPSLADVEKGMRVLMATRESLSRFCAWLSERSDEELASAPHKE